jgi:hypothetical protein
MNPVATATAAATLAVVAMSMPHARAATSASNATGMCQSALPVFDTQIRKRPLGVSNEGSSSAFVSCSVPVGYNPDTVDNGAIFLTNRNAGAVIVSCTLVDGALAAQDPGYYPQTVAALPGEVTIIVWDPADHGLETFQSYPNYSCNLPPGVEINVVGNDYTESTPT